MTLYRGRNELGRIAGCEMVLMPPAKLSLGKASYEVKNTCVCCHEEAPCKNLSAVRWAFTGG